MEQVFDMQDFIVATQADEGHVLGKFLYFSLANLLVCTSFIPSIWYRNSSISLAATAEAKTDNVTYQVTYELYAFDEKADKKYLLSTEDDTVPVEGNTQYKAKFEVKFVKASAE